MGETTKFLPNYYSIDDIFVTQEKMPCRSLQVQRKMGFLDAGSESEDLGKVKVDLPLWYCLAIGSSRNMTFKIEIPEIYSKVYVDICKADAKVVDLGKLNKYFFQFGRYVARFDSTGEVAKMLSDTFRTRMRFLVDQIHNDKVVDVRNELGLDNLEYQIFKATSGNLAKFTRWMKGDSLCTIEASDLVKQHRKRRHEDEAEDDIV